ncbi:MAG TPA: glutaminyl-peptide cyclotransferase [Ohtaekwangia sp.]
MKNLFFSLSALLLLSLLATSCKTKDSDKPPVTDSLTINYTVINTLPHNAEAFTEGLVIHNNKILESTGQNNSSWIAEVKPSSGEHDKKVILPEEYFGEGITILNNKIYHLTYTTKIGFIYDANTYKKLGEFTYSTQGWGMTHDHKNLIMSDGSEKLYFLDTVSLKPVRTLTVTMENNPLKELNELEYIDGYIFANVWQTSWIVKIDPATGKVVGRMDLSQLANQIRSMYPQADVLNGIAYDANSKSLLVTGKMWPKAYLIKLK